MTEPEDQITRDRIVETERVIRPYIRRTPMLQANTTEFGLSPGPLWLKLELLQHSGSFKARGAFANRLAEGRCRRRVGREPRAAVAYAAQQLGIPATIFVPCIRSGEMDRIWGCGATLIVEGERYADAFLAASERFVRETGGLAIYATRSG